MSAAERAEERELFFTYPELPRRMPQDLMSITNEAFAQLTPEQQVEWRNRWAEDFRRHYVVDKEPLLKVRAGVPHRLDERREYDKVNR